MVLSCIQRRDSDAESFHSAGQLEQTATADDCALWLDVTHQEVKRRWLGEVLPAFPEAMDDPFLSPSAHAGATDQLVARFLRAERNQRPKDEVETTVRRLRETAQFRREYRCIDFHRQGMARRLFMHGSNPGASIYFGDAGLRDAAGRPVLVGRIGLMVDERAPGRKASDRMIPCAHLRAGIMVIERAVTLAGGASYILDLSGYPSDEMASHAHGRYWDADGAIDCSEAIRARRKPDVSVGPHLPSHEACPEGLPTLKEALRIATHHYPESLHSIWFYNPGLLFSMAYRIFSAWLPHDTRGKLHIVRKGEECAHFLAPGALDPKRVPVELGGSGPSLDGDRFLLRAVELYDATATRSS
jgi:hypothetical protein